MNETFRQEEELVNTYDMQTVTTNVSNVSDILFQNGIDLNNLSGVSAFQEGFAASSTNDGLSSFTATSYQNVCSKKETS